MPSGNATARIEPRISDRWPDSAVGAWINGAWRPRSQGSKLSLFALARVRIRTGCRTNRKWSDELINLAKTGAKVGPSLYSE